MSWRGDSVWFALAVGGAIGLGLFMHWPSLDSGFRGDDYPQRAMVRGEFPVPRSAFDLFDFSSGDRADVEALTDFGYLPWWSEPNLRLRMWRPIASALIAWDHRTFGDDARWHHLHSLGWYVLLVLVAAKLYRRWLTLPAAALATLLFALEEGHTVPIGWLANRSTLIATALGLLALELHASVRDAADGCTPAARRLRQGAAALCTSLALLSGEYAFTALAYVFAYECLRRDPIRQRVLASLPVLLPTAGYLVLHNLVGATITGSGYYLSPLRDPIAYGQAAVLRLPALFADLMLGVPAEWFNGSGPFRNYILSLELLSADVWRNSPGWPVWHALIGYLALVLGYAVLRLALQLVAPGAASAAPSAAGADRRRWLQVLALGSLLALVPAAGSLPGDRLIVAAAFGVAGVVASVLAHGWPPLAALRARRAWPRLLATVLLLAVSVRGGVRLYEQVRGYAYGAEAQRAWALAAGLPDRDAHEARVYLLTTTDFNTAANLPWMRSAHGMPLPRVYRRLCPAVAPIDVVRSGPRSLQIRVLSSDLEGSALPSLYRGAAAWLSTGQRFELPGLLVTVLQAREGNPASMQFDFDLDLDDPRLWLMQSTVTGLHRIPAPALGERVRLPLPLWGDLRPKR